MKETIVKQIVWSNYEELAAVPSSWLIFNAPRPIYGTKVWSGPFLEGRFWCVLDPEEYDHDGVLRNNLLLQACVVRYVTAADARIWVEKWAENEYGIDKLCIVTKMTDREIWAYFTRENKVTQEFTIDR